MTDAAKANGGTEPSDVATRDASARWSGQCHITAGRNLERDVVLTVGHHDLRDLRLDELAAYRRTTIGFIFQHFGLFDLLSARENIELAASLSVRSTRRRPQAGDLLEEVGLLDRAEHRPGQLSGGERQRVAIARALVNDPSLILADEPTGNLDAGSAMRVLDLLERVHTERGCTLLVVTHNEAVAQRAEQRFRLDAGRLLG